MPPGTPATFRELDYLGHRWNAQADRPVAQMEFYQRAHLFAEIAFASYWDEVYMRELCDHFGFQDLVYFELEGAHTYILSNQYDTIVACRGTEAGDWNDIRASLKVWKEAAGSVGRVHGGFNDEVDHLWPEIEAALILDEKPLYFTGHSLGGAMAQICASRCRSAVVACEPLEIQTFGCPRVGDRHFVSHCEIRKIRWVNNNDFAARFPPAIIGFRHSGLEMYIDGAGNISGLRGLKRLGNRIASFARGIASARIDHLSDHLMPAYIAPILQAARAEAAR